MSENIAGFFIDGWYVFDNFAAFQIEWRGKIYPTTEHAYQAAHFFETAPEIAEMIRLLPSPQLASEVANTHAYIEDKGWSKKKVTFMEEIIRTKYDQHEFVQKTLKESGTREIIEMNDNDSFWGWGPDHNGRNELGKIWMRLRDETDSL